MPGLFKGLYMKKLFLSFLALSISAINAQAPSVHSMQWGEIVIEHNNSIKTYKDCKLWPNGSCEWDWSIAGTRHKPGIQIKDFESFVDSVDIVILSRGYDLMLHVTGKALNYLQEKSKKYYIEQSEKAVQLYNKLVKEGKKVGALIHTTC